MNTTEQYTSLFPMKVMVTQDIIDKGSVNLRNSSKCIGALTLLKGLGHNKKLLEDGCGMWGTSVGYQYLTNGSEFKVGAFVKEEPIDLMGTTEPIEVEFRVLYVIKY